MQIKLVSRVGHRHLNHRAEILSRWEFCRPRTCTQPHGRLLLCEKLETEGSELEAVKPRSDLLLLPPAALGFLEVSLADPDRIRRDLDELVVCDPLDGEFERKHLVRLELDRIVS